MLDCISHKMVNTFQLNKKYAEWAERTVYNYFKKKHNQIGVDIFYFGSQVGTVKRDKGDAPLRPDFIFLKNKDVRYLEKKYKINFNNIKIANLKKILKLDNTTYDDLKKFPEHWMTKILDRESMMKDIIKRTHCMLEIKSGFWIFDKIKYDNDNLNIILPLDFDKRIRRIKKKFKTNFKVYAAYILLDKAYIANTKDVRKWERASFGGRETEDRILSFRKSYFFGNIIGAVRYANKKPIILGKPFIEVEKGAVRFSLKMPPARMTNVNVSVIKKLLN